MLNHHQMGQHSMRAYCWYLAVVDLVVSSMWACCLRTPGVVAVAAVVVAADLLWTPNSKHHLLGQHSMKASYWY